MAIYFGNLDRELDDRQRVLQEDAARQYRGVRDMRQSFGSLGDTVSSSIKDVAQAKLDQAKLEYNVRRNEEADEIRAEQHSQATQRNRELSLDSTLKNIAGFRKSSIEDYIGKLWFWRDPKAVRASYAERMKIFTADKDTLDPAQRIQMYPNLFGTKAVRKLEAYKLLLDNKKKGETVSDKDINAALNKLPLTPMNFMDWAKDTGMYNTKMKGINPTRIPNAMQRAALIEAGYNIPDPNKLLEQNQGSVTNVGVEIESGDGGTAADGLGEDVTSDPDDADNLTATTTESGGLDSDEGGVYIEDTTGDALSLGGGGVVSDSSTVTTDGETIDKYGQGHYKDGVWVSATGDVMSLGGDQTGTSVATEVGGAWHPGVSGTPETLADQKLSEEADSAVQNVMKVNEDRIKAANVASALRRYDGRERFNQVSNPFKIAAGITAPAAKATADSIILERDKVKRDPGDELYTLQGSERDRDPAFFPFMEASRGRKLGAFYGKQPNYSTWENVSPEEKKAILTHPETEMYGASPKSVAGLIKARENLEDIDEQIGFLKDEVTKHDKNISTWKDAAQSWQAILPDGKPTHQYGGMLDEHPEKRRARTNLAMQLPLLKEERQKLLDRFNTAQSEVDASATKYRKKGRDWGEPSVLSSSGTPIISPTDTSQDDGGFLPNIISTQPPRDDGTQAAVKANYAADTEEEIIEGIIEREGFGPANAGYSYFDGPKPGLRGYYKEGDAEILTLAGGNNIWGTINGMPAKERKQAIEEVAYNLFGQGGVRKREFIRFLNMPKKDHKKEYDTIVKRGRLRLTEGQRDYLTRYSYRNHLERMVKHHPYLSGIAQYPKEMQVFLMDNAFNMGPRWLKDKFTKTEKHLRRWVETRLPSDLEKMKEEYKNSDHYRNTNRAKDLVAMID